MMTAQSNHTYPPGPGHRPAKPLLLGIVLAVLLGALFSAGLLLLGSWLLCHTELPLYAAAPISTAAVSVGAAAAGATLARLQKKNGLLWGIAVGLFFFLAFTTAALIHGAQTFSTFSAIKLMCFVLGGALGGYMGMVWTERKAAARHRAPM